MSLISKLKAVVAGDEYLDDDFDELDYASEDELNDINNFKQNPKNANVLANSNPFDFINSGLKPPLVGSSHNLTCNIINGFFFSSREILAVSYTHLTLPTTPYV